MRTRSAFVSSLFIALSACAALMGLAREARACSCVGESRVLWPSDQSTLPQGALVIVDDGCATLDDAHAGDLRATVDGQEVSLIANDDANFVGGVGFSIEPAPAVGAIVEITSPSDAVSFTVVASDDDAPRAPTLSEFEFERVTAPLDCGDNPTPARDWSLNIAAADPGEPRIYVVSVGPEGEDPSRKVVFSDGDALEVVVRRLDEDAGSEVCATVQTFDASGNAPEAARLCRELAADEAFAAEGCSVGGRSANWAALALVALGCCLRRRSRA